MKDPTTQSAMLSDLHPFYNHHFEDAFIIIICSYCSNKCWCWDTLYVSSNSLLINLNVASDEQQKLNHFRELRRVRVLTQWQRQGTSVDHFELLRSVQQCNEEQSSTGESLESYSCCFRVKICSYSFQALCLHFVPDAVERSYYAWMHVDLHWLSILQYLTQACWKIAPLFS